MTPSHGTDKAAEDYIFYMMQSIYSVVPDASLIHMTAYKLDQHFYLSRDYDRIVEPLKESEASAEAPVRAYGSYAAGGSGLHWSYHAKGAFRFYSLPPTLRTTLYYRSVG